MTKRTALAILLLGAFMASALSFPALAQNPLQKLEQTVKEKAADDAMTKFLNDQLPLILNAKNVYPTVNTLPGGPFQPQPLQLTADDLDKPLPPGDYSVQTLAFCSEYSVHRPGAGVAYVIGPLEGKAAGAIGALYWRGTVLYHLAPPQLVTVGWAIQSGLTYAQMPKSYQAIIDRVIPDLKNELNGDFFQGLENTYQTYAKTLSLPPLDTVLAKMGKPGELALSAERQRAILLLQSTNDQLKDQTLFQGQESGVYTPVKAENGPWTERIPGVAYLKLNIVGGHLASNNQMLIRILPTPPGQASLARSPRLVRAAYQAPQSSSEVSPTLSSLLEGSIGYSQGQGAQALAQVPVVSGQAPPPPPQQSIAHLRVLQGTATITHNGVTSPLTPSTPIYMNDTIQTGAGSKADVLFADNTEMTLGDNAKLQLDDYVYDPNVNSNNKATYSLLEGAFVYVSGLIGKKDPDNVRIETQASGIGTRGTKFILRTMGTNSFEIDLIEGAVAVDKTVTASTPSITAPVKILRNGTNTSLQPLSQDEYNQILSQLNLAPPTS
jgi:hypothetical protein